MRCFAVILLSFAISIGQTVFAASVHWSGASIAFSNTGGANAVDEIIAGIIELTRGGQGGIYNAAQETGSGGPDSNSPAGTRWAVSGLNSNPVFSFGEAANLGAGLQFDDWADAYGGRGSLRGNITDNPAVLLIPSSGSLPDDIYIDVVFTAWGATPSDGGTFTYTRSSAPAVIPIPAALPLFLSAFAGLAWCARRCNGML